MFIYIPQYIHVHNFVLRSFSNLNSTENTRTLNETEMFVIDNSDEVVRQTTDTQSPLHKTYK